MAKLYALVDRRQVNVLLASRTPLSGELRDDVSRLADLLTRQFQLEPFRPEETQVFVKLAEREGWPSERGVAAEIQRLTHGHPYRLQYYLRALLEDHDRLSKQGLREVHNTANIAYLNDVLMDRGAPSRTSGATIFVSYSRQDKAEKLQLVTHLRVLDYANHTVTWSDAHIGVGTPWETEIRQVIETARVAVLLVSANFLTSAYINEKEIPWMRQRHLKGKLTIVSLIAKHCEWQAHPWLMTLGARPKHGQPVWRDNGVHVDQELTRIVHEVRTILTPD